MTECPICGNILQTPIVKGVGGIDDIQVYECMECSLQFHNTWKDMEKAENFYKSPEGLFKAGIPIGKIEKNELDEKNKVNFFSDFSQLRFVKVKSFEKEESN